MAILAVIEQGEREQILGVGWYAIIEDIHIADIVLAVRDDSQDKGIGTELSPYLTCLAKKKDFMV